MHGINSKQRALTKPFKLVSRINFHSPEETTLSWNKPRGHVRYVLILCL